MIRKSPISPHVVVAAAAEEAVLAEVSALVLVVVGVGVTVEAVTREDNPEDVVLGAGLGVTVGTLA